MKIEIDLGKIDYRLKFLLAALGSVVFGIFVIILIALICAYGLFLPLFFIVGGVVSSCCAARQFMDGIEYDDPTGFVFAAVLGVLAGGAFLAAIGVTLT